MIRSLFLLIRGNIIADRPSVKLLDSQSLDIRTHDKIHKKLRVFFMLRTLDHRASVCHRAGSLPRIDDRDRRAASIYFFAVSSKVRPTRYVPSDTSSSTAPDPAAIRRRALWQTVPEPRFHASAGPGSSSPASCSCCRIFPDPQRTPFRPSSRQTDPQIPAGGSRVHQLIVVDQNNGKLRKRSPDMILSPVYTLDMIALGTLV